MRRGLGQMVSPWGGGVRGINHLGGSYLSDFGNDLDNDAIGIFWSDNPNNLWALQTVFCDIRGNHFQHNGTVGSFLRSRHLQPVLVVGDGAELV